MGGEEGRGREEEEDFPLELSGLSLSALKLFFLFSGFYQGVFSCVCTVCMCIHRQYILCDHV